MDDPGDDARDPDDPRDGGAPGSDFFDEDALHEALDAAFDGSAAERRVVARQARDLADSGQHLSDRGHPLAVDDVIENLSDAPEGSSLVDRWNWWMGALDVAYGGYEPFQVRRYRGE